MTAALSRVANIAPKVGRLRVGRLRVAAKLAANNAMSIALNRARTPAMNRAGTTAATIAVAGIMASGWSAWVIICPISCCAALRSPPAQRMSPTMRRRLAPKAEAIPIIQKASQSARPFAFQSLTPLLFPLSRL